MNLTVAGVVCVSVCRSCVDFVWCCVALPHSAGVCVCALLARLARYFLIN